MLSRLLNKRVKAYVDDVVIKTKKFGTGTTSP
jgi:hypothetical protein